MGVAVTAASAHHPKNIANLHFIIHSRNLPMEAMDQLHLPDPSAAPHPDSALRLASTVHRFSIVRSFVRHHGASVGANYNYFDVTNDLI